MVRPEDILGVLFIAGGLWGIYRQRRREEKVRASQSWPFAKGKILSSEVESELSAMRFLRANFWLYKAKIEYEYSVGSQTHTGDTVCIGGEINTSFPKRAEERCQRYPVGSEVNVYYDPLDPETSCLEQEGEGSVLGYAVFAAFIIFGLLLWSGLVGRR